MEVNDFQRKSVHPRVWASPLRMFTNVSDLSMAKVWLFNYEWFGFDNQKVFRQAPKAVRTIKRELVGIWNIQDRIRLSKTKLSNTVTRSMRCYAMNKTREVEIFTPRLSILETPSERSRTSGSMTQLLSLRSQYLSTETIISGTFLTTEKVSVDDWITNE